MLSSLKQALTPPSEGIRPLADSLAEELTVLVFGRSFTPNRRSEGRSISHDRPSTHKELKTPPPSKRDGIEKEPVKCETNPQENGYQGPTGAKLTYADSHVEIETATAPETPISHCVETDSIVGGSDVPLTSSLPSPDCPEPPTPEASRRKRKSKGRRRKRGAEKNDHDGIGEAAESPSQSESSAGHLPDHILYATFQRVMAQGLVLTLISPGKRSEMTFWIDDGVLKWGKQKQNGKERGQIELRSIVSVVDSGTLEVRLGASSGMCLEVGASSLVEKALLLRCFVLASHA